MSSWLEPPVQAVQPVCWRPLKRTDSARYPKPSGLDLKVKFRGAPTWGDVYVGIQILDFPFGPTWARIDLVDLDMTTGEVWIPESELTRQNIEVLASQPALSEFSF